MTLAPVAVQEGVACSESILACQLLLPCPQTLVAFTTTAWLLAGALVDVEVGALGHLRKQRAAPWDIHSAQGSLASATPQQPRCPLPIPTLLALLLLPFHGSQSSTTHVALYPNGQELLWGGINT